MDGRVVVVDAIGGCRLVHNSELEPAFTIDGLLRANTMLASGYMSIRMQRLDDELHAKKGEIHDQLRDIQFALDNARAAFSKLSARVAKLEADRYKNQL